MLTQQCGFDSIAKQESDDVIDLIQLPGRGVLL